MNLGNFVTYIATNGHPEPVPGWMEWAVWPFLLLVVLLTRPRRR